MKRKTAKYLLLLIFLIVSISCRREEFSISQVLAQPYIRQSGEMSMSVFLHANVPDNKKINIVITAPSGDLTWTPEAETTDMDGISYVGSSCISMPDGNKLPMGKWTVELLYKDGRTVRETFNVEYRYKEDIVKERLLDKRTSFDPETNLVFVN